MTNLINGKIYIGQTVNRIEKRKVDHYSNARMHKFKVPFHNAIRKYGEECFKWEAIDKALDKEELNKKEKYWISFYDSNNRNKGYNATIGGDAFGGKGEENFWHGKERTEENKTKISEALKETRRKKGNPRDRAVIQLSTNGEFIAEYPSSKKAEELLNMEYQKVINACCRGKQVSAHGYLWIYKDSYTKESVDILVEKHKDRKGGVDKSVIALDLNGVFVKEYSSIEEAVAEVGGSGSNVTACCRGRQKTCKGYIWIYKRDYKG